MGDYVSRRTYGRKRIIIEKEVTRDTIIEILQEAIPIHTQNVEDMQYLINYCKGEQNIYKRSNYGFSCKFFRLF